MIIVQCMVQKTQNYHYSLGNNLKQHNSHLLCGRGLTSLTHCPVFKMLYQSSDTASTHDGVTIHTVKLCMNIWRWNFLFSKKFYCCVSPKQHITMSHALQYCMGFAHNSTLLMTLKWLLYLTHRNNFCVKQHSRLGTIMPEWKIRSIWGDHFSPCWKLAVTLLKVCSDSDNIWIYFSVRNNSVCGILLFPLGNLIHINHRRLDWQNMAAKNIHNQAILGSNLG